MARTPEEIGFWKLEAEAAQCDDDAEFKRLLEQARQAGLWKRAYQTWAEYLEKRWDIDHGRQD